MINPLPSLRDGCFCFVKNFHASSAVHASAPPRTRIAIASNAPGVFASALNHPVTGMKKSAKTRKPVLMFSCVSGCHASERLVAFPATQWLRNAHTAARGMNPSRNKIMPPRRFLQLVWRAINAARSAATSASPEYRVRYASPANTPEATSHAALSFRRRQRLTRPSISLVFSPA